jgi:hypothetical protein
MSKGMLIDPFPNRPRNLTEDDLTALGRQACRNAGLAFDAMPADQQQRVRHGVEQALRAMLDLGWLVVAPERESLKKGG